MAGCNETAMECGDMRFYRCVLMACLAAGCGAANDGPSGSSPTSAQTAATATDGVRVAEAQPPAIVQASAETAKPADRRAEATALVARAEQLHRQGDALGTLRALTAAIAATPDSADLYSKRAAVLASAQLLPKAIADITRAIELAPRDAKLHNSRGFYFLSQQNYDRAMEDFNDAIGLDLAYSHPYNNRGLLRIATGDPEKAIADFDAALRIDPKYRDALNNRGLALMQVKRFDEALESFTSALDLSPEYPTGWNNRGLAYHKLKRHADAVADFTKAIELQPDVPKYYVQRAEALEQLDRREAALKDIEYATSLVQVAEINQSIKRSPSDAGLWVRRGQVLLSADRLDEALADFERALRLNPDNAAALTGRAAVALRRGNSAQAVKDASQAIEVQHDFIAFSLRGDAFFAQGDYDHAIEDYVAAQRADSQVARAYLLRSEQRKAAGQVDQASADFDRAVSLDPSLSPEDAARLKAAQPVESDTPRELPPLPDDVQALPEQ